MTQSRLPDVRRPWLASFTAGGLAPRPPWKEHSAHPQPVLSIHVYFPHLLFLMFWEMFGERNMGRVLGTVSPTVNWGRTSSVIEMTVGASVQGSSKFAWAFWTWFKVTTTGTVWCLHYCRVYKWQSWFKVTTTDTVWCLHYCQVYKWQSWFLAAQKL